MSYTETPEQRQIRILRNSISSMRSDNDRLSSQNRRLEREMELVQDIKDEAQWLIRIVENLLSVTRINGENAKINTEDEVDECLRVLKELLPLLRRYRRG